MAIPKQRPRLLLTWISACAMLAGCVSLPDMRGAPALQAGSAASPELPAVDAPALVVLGQAAAGQQILVEDALAVTPGPSYTSASGRTCRTVLLQPRDGAGYRRLACSSGGEWQWVRTATPEFTD